MFGSPAFILLFRISYVKIADKVLFMEGVGRDMDSMDKSFDIFFFDLDGTLTESSLGITNSVIYALKKFGIEETDRTKLYSFIGPPLTDSFEKFCGFTKEQCAEAVRYYREYYREKGIFENHVYDGMEEVLKELKRRGKTLVVATSKPEPFAIERVRLSNILGWIHILTMWQEWNFPADAARRKRSSVMRFVPVRLRTSPKC